MILPLASKAFAVPIILFLSASTKTNDLTSLGGSNSYVCIPPLALSFGLSTKPSLLLSITFSGMITICNPPPTSRSLSFVPVSSASKIITSFGLPP